MTLILLFQVGKIKSHPRTMEVVWATIDVLEGMAVEKGAQVCENCRKRWRSYGHRVTPTKILDSVVVNTMLYHLDFI
ncbi:hypothetical protein E4U44_008094 [Claviceps purpurea]|nr:hypothetical protein E4U44_008094 [Claviceps purpurea]